MKKIECVKGKFRDTENQFIHFNIHLIGIQKENEEE